MTPTKADVFVSPSLTSATESSRTESDGKSRPGQWLCIAGAAFGALGLFGHVLDLDLLTTLVPGQPVMMPNTAIGLLLIGGAGALRQSSWSEPAVKSLPVVAAFLVLSIGVATLAEYALGADLHIDQLVLSVGTEPDPGRPSPPTAFTLACLAASILLSDVRTTASIRPSEWLAFFSGVTAITALMGFVFGAEPLYRLASAPVKAVAVPTAVSLLLTSTGLLLERPTAGIMRVAMSTGPGGVLLRRLVAPAILAPVFIGLMVLRFASATGIESLPVVIAMVAATLTAVGLLTLTLIAVQLNRKHEALEAMRMQTKSLVEQAPDGVFVADLDGRYIDVNNAGCDILGYTREEIIGKSIIDFIPPEDAARLVTVRDELLDGATSFSEWRLRSKSGGHLPVDVSAKILPDGRWQGFVRDISERKRLENELRFLAQVGQVLATSLDYEETLSRIVELAVLMLSDFCIVDVVDDEGELRRLRVVSRDPSRAGTCELLQRVPPDHKPPLLVRSVLESKQPVFIERTSSQDLEALAQSDDHLDALRSIELQSVMVLPLLAHGKLMGVISLLSSTAHGAYGLEDRRIADALAQRAAIAVDNARLYRAAQRAVQGRDEVLGIVAHDLRNPLSAILVEAQMLRQRGVEALSREAGEAIAGVATRMNDLIQDLLDVTRMEAGRLNLQPDRLSAAGLASAAVDAQRSLASSASLELRLDLAPSLGDLWADRDRVLQVFDNLIGNAIKFTPPGGCITVGGESKNDDVLFFVQDTGPGIPLDEQPHLFDRFWQARRDGRQGIGLGLPIVQAIITAHGRRVWVESAPGQGTTFFFAIPTAPRNDTISLVGA